MYIGQCAMLFCNITVAEPLRYEEKKAVRDIFFWMKTSESQQCRMPKEGTYSGTLVYI